MSSLTFNNSSNSGIGAATSMINRRTFDPNRPTSLYLPINYDQELGTKLRNNPNVGIQLFFFS